MFGVLNKLKDKVAAKAKLIGTKDVMEAIGAGCCAVAWADGQLEPQEKEKFSKLVQGHPMMDGLDRIEIMRIFNRFSEAYELDHGIGQQAALKELKDIKGQEKRETLFLLYMSIAGADGEVEPAEKTLLRRICSMWELSPSDYDI